MHVFPIRLGPNAREAMQEEILYTARHSEEGLVVETGGWCWGPDSDWSEDGIDILESSGPGPTAAKSWDEVFLPTEYLLSMDELYRRESLQLTAGWHIHPAGGDTPSEVDLGRIEFVLNLRKIQGARTARAVELILTPRADPYWGFRKQGYRVPTSLKDWKITAWCFYKGIGGILGDEGLWPEGAYIEQGELTP